MRNFYYYYILLFITPVTFYPINHSDTAGGAMKRKSCFVKKNED